MTNNMSWRKSKCRWLCIWTRILWAKSISIWGEGGVDSYNNVDETNEYDPNENIVNPEVPE